MKVADCMSPVPPRYKKKGRNITSYRAARRNIAKIDYRRRKKGIA